MNRLSRYWSKVLTAAGISAAIAISFLGTPIAANAATAATDSVMIRNDASTDAGLIGSLNEGDEVVILDVVQSGDGYLWYYIELDNGNTGYVRSDLINASDEELAAFRDVVNEQETEEETEQEAQETEGEDEQQEQEAPAPEQAKTPEEEAEQAPAAEAAAGEGYDATKDPNANFNVRFETEADGTGSWYVYNDDNGSKVRVSELQSAESGTAAAAKGYPGIWKTLAIVFGVLAAALLAFALFLIKSIRDGRSSSSRRRAMAAAAQEDEEEEEDEFYFEDDEPSEEEEEALEEETVEEESESESDDAPEEPSDDGAVTQDSTITREIPEESAVDEIPAEEIEAAIAAEAEQIEKDFTDGAEETSEKVLPESQDAEAEEVPAEEVIQEEMWEEEPAAEEPAPVDEPESYDESYDDEVEDEEYEDEDYEEESDDEAEDDSEDYVYEDEEYEDEDSFDEDDDEDEEPAERRRSGSSRKSDSGKGGFLGFLKKVFGSDSSEDEEDGDDFDDYDDEPEREFDEFKEYPEDVDLLPREEIPESELMDEEDQFEDAEPADDSSRGRLTMQKVMKNVQYNEKDSAFSDDGDMYSDDLSDSLFDDDDDMEYSFISSTRRK